MSELVVDVGVNDTHDTHDAGIKDAGIRNADALPRSVIGDRLAKEFARRNMPVLVKYAEETQYHHAQYSGGKYRVNARASTNARASADALTRHRFESAVPRRILKMRETDEPIEQSTSLADYESQDDPFTPRIEDEYLGGADDGYALPILDSWPGIGDAYVGDAYVDMGADADMDYMPFSS
jgi:hypothetical protein